MNTTKATCTACGEQIRWDAPLGAWINENADWFCTAADDESSHWHTAN
jgi:hypothetical protein